MVIIWAEQWSRDTTWIGSVLLTEVDEGPLDALLLVLLLLEDEHVVVEELLELLVHKVAPQLLETVEVEDFEARDVEDTFKRKTS